jgi:DNA (cytosine-5)-methyltransferase 1
VLPGGLVNHIDLFAGMGGFAYGFEQAGIETIAHVEIDKNCQQVLRKHWPDHLIYGDIQLCGEGRPFPLPYADIISFGSPCQDLSVAGRREGLDGKRSNLFFEGARIIREVGPDWAVWENVPGALSSNQGRDFQAVIAELLQADIPMPRSGRWARTGVARSGQATLAWRVLDSQYFGLAQRRKRVFVVVHFGGEGSIQVLLEPEGLPGDTPPSRKAGEGAASHSEESTIDFGRTADRIRIDPDTSVTLQGDGGGMGAKTGLYLFNDAVDVRNFRLQGGVSGTLQAKENGSYSLNYTNPVMVSRDCARSLRSQAQLSHREDSDNYVTVAFRTNQTGAQGPIHSIEVTDTLALDHPPAVTYRMQRSDQCEEDEVASTIAMRDYKSSTDLMVGTVGVRRLTPVECMRLQGFPDDWCDGMSDSTQYRMAGNVVSTTVTEWLGRRIKYYDRP